MIPVAKIVGSIIIGGAGAFYYKNINSEQYDFINKDGTYNINEMQRCINNKYIKTPIKAYISELNKRVEVVYRSLIDGDIQFLSISSQKNTITFTPNKYFTTMKSIFSCTTIDEFYEELDKRANEFIKLKDKHFFRDRQKFIADIAICSNNRCYGEITNWKYISIKKKSNDEELACVYVDNDMKTMKIEAGKTSYKLTLYDGTRALAQAVFYWIAFTFHDSILDHKTIKKK